VNIIPYSFCISADISTTPYCEIQLTEEKQKAFSYAVKNHYWYQMYLDDLPVWGKCSSCETVIGNYSDVGPCGAIEHHKKDSVVKERMNIH
jgi:hypothetical protein